MGVSRRTLLLGAGGAALIGVPAAQHFAWNAKDFTRNDYTPDLPDAPDGEDIWTNWSGLHTASPKQIARPETEGAIAELFENTSGRIRPVGSGHSFVALAPSEGVMVDVSRISGLSLYDDATGHATFGAGTRLFEMARSLADIGRAVPNLPDIDVQTLAGSFSTATHGTGLELAALHDYIVSFRIVTPERSILDVNAASHPNLFAAGKVSLGALGIITQYTLKTVPAFNLRRRVHAERIEDVLDRIEDLSRAHRNFEFFYLPNTGFAATIAHDIHEGPVTGRAENEDDEMLHDLQALRDQLGWWPWLRRRLIGAELEPGLMEDVNDESWRLLATTRPTKFNEMEYHLPLERGVKVLRKVIKYFDKRKDAFFPMEVRVTGADTAWLSPFNDGPRMSIAVHAAVNERYDYFLSDLQPLYLENGGRPHWGKLHNLKQTDFRAMYPQFDAFNALRAEMDPDGRLLNPHLADLFGAPFNG